jgi:hypothetical protein
VPDFLEEAPNPDLKAVDFQAIANDPKTYTADRLVRFLERPHFPMSRIPLSDSEIRSIIAFIGNLKSDQRRVD